MIYFVLLASLVGFSMALVCTPQLCNMMGTPKPLNCAGSVIKNGGLCGCTDACAKVEGEICQAVHMFGMIPVGSCDEGLQCVQDTNEHLRQGVGLCKKTEKVSERFVDDSTQTICQTIRAQRMISFVIWKGMWTPNCDEKGLFLPKQCDNQQKCFCVDAHDGHLLTERMLGHVDCSSVRGDVTTTVQIPVQDAVEKRIIGNKQTICQTIRAQRMISFVIWEGMWTPNCDEKGLFLPKQCDNQHKCFCVDAHDGHLLTERMLGHVDCSTINTDVTTTVKTVTAINRIIGGTQTICQTIRAQRMISFVIWKGMWTPNCDEKGLFVPKQCDNQNKCFCVDDHDGHLLTERMLGHVDCSTALTKPPATISPVSSVETRSISKCRQMKAKAMTSLVVYEGMWVPQCDMQGLFMEEQCDFDHKCFCVDVHDGRLLTERMLGHPDCSSLTKTITHVLV